MDFNRLLGSTFCRQFPVVFVFLIFIYCLSEVSTDCSVVIDHNFPGECHKPTRCRNNWTALTLSGDTYNELASDFFSSCSNIVDLLLLNAPIKVLERERLRGLSSLKTLTMNNVPAYKFSPGLFSEFPSLTEMTVSRAKTFQLLAVSFKPCSKLQKIAFERTPLEHLDSMVFSACDLTLRTIYLRSGQLREISPKAFGHLTSLKQLDLSSNRLVELGPNIFKDLSDLRSLVLRQNFIRSIDANAFQGLTALTTLDLSNNRITELPSNTLTKMPYLKRLKLENNRILHFDLTLKDSAQRLMILMKGNRLTCRPRPGKDTPKFEGLPVELTFCPEPVPTTRPPKAVSIQSPKHQRLEAKKKATEGKDGGSWLTSNRQMVIMTPSWLLAWAICMTIAFVIVVCILAFILHNRRKAAQRERHQSAEEQDAPLNNVANL